MRLTVPFVTQQDNAYKGDCGLACFAMIANTTIMNAYSLTGVKRGEWALFNDLRYGLRQVGIDANYTQIRVGEMRFYLSLGLPIIVLMNYGALTPRLKNARYNGAHFVIAVGFTDNGVLVHDPLGGGDTGAYVEYQDELLADAMVNVPDNYYPNQCMIVQKSFAPLKPDNGELLANALATVDALRRENKRLLKARKKPL